MQKEEGKRNGAIDLEKKRADEANEKEEDRSMFRLH